MMRISDIMEKEIINVKNGKKLGFITDIDLDVENGKVSSFSITGSSGNFFYRGAEIDTVYWKDILRIGCDTIIVSIGSVSYTHLPDCEILFVGTKNGIESEIVPKAGFELKTVTVQGFKRKIAVSYTHLVNQNSKKIEKDASKKLDMIYPAEYQKKYISVDD